MLAQHVRAQRVGAACWRSVLAQRVLAQRVGAACWRSAQRVGAACEFALSVCLFVWSATVTLHVFFCFLDKKELHDITLAEYIDFYYLRVLVEYIRKSRWIELDNSV